MEKKRRLLRLHFLIMLAFLSSSFGLTEAATWSGHSTGDVFNDNLTLDATDGPIFLQTGPVTITASTTDVIITMISGDVTLEGEDTLHGGGP